MNENIARVMPTAITIYTDGSTSPGNPGPSGYGFYGIDNLNYTYNGYGPVGILSTNNASELTAVLRAIQYILIFPEIKDVLIYSDSKYFIDGFNYLAKWERAKWNKSDGTAIANLSLWKDIQAVILQYKAAGGTIKFKWIRGHNGDHGNEMADRNANLGRLNAVQHITIHTCTITEPVTETVPVEVIDNVKKTKKGIASKLVPLLSGKRWFFNTNQPEQLNDGRYYYLTSSYLDTPKKLNVNLAKRSPDTHYSIYLTDTPIEELNTLRERVNNGFPDMNLPIIANLNIITKANVWAYMVATKNRLTKIKGNMIVNNDSTVLGAVITPPKLIFKLENIYNYGFDLLTKFENNNPEILYIDITSNCLTSTGKGAQHINAGFIQSLKLLKISDIKITDNINKDVNLVVGTDIPCRNTFSSLLKITKAPIKVTMLIFDITKHSYRVATIVEYENNKAVYYAIDSNCRVIG